MLGFLEMLVQFFFPRPIGDDNVHGIQKKKVSMHCKQNVLNLPPHSELHIPSLQCFRVTVNTEKKR